MKRLIFLLFLFAVPAWSQTTINGRVQTGTNALKPATCSGGDQYNAIDTFQIFVCGPANTWVAAGGGGVTGSFTAGNTVYASNTTALSAGTVVLDMAGIAGANLGAKMNACVSQLPSNIGICMGDNLTGAQTLSTAVTVTAPASVVFTFCGQQISQSAAISGDGYSIKGCASKATTFTKAANIDMMTLTGFYQSISDITITGNRPTNTGDGIVLSGATYETISDVVIQGIKGSSIHCVGGLYSSVNDVKVFDFGDHAYLESGCITYINSASMSDTQLSAVATGATVQATGSESIYTGGTFDNSSGFPVINIVSGGSPSTFTGIDAQNVGGFEAIILGGAGDILSNSTLVGGGASHVAVNAGSGQVTNSFVNVITPGSDGVVLNGFGRMTNSRVSFNVGGVTGKCGINILGEAIGAYVGNNNVASTGTGSGPNYGVCVTAVTAQHSLDNFVQNNYIDWADVTNSAAVRFDNTAGIGANAANNKFRDNVCIHIHFCVSRVDTQGNRNVYENNQGDPTATFDSGGSVNDILTQLVDSVGLTFATLPLAGSGSIIYCVDCTPLNPTTGGGTGALIFRVAGVWMASSPPAGISFSNNPVNSTAAIGSAVAQNSTKLSSFYVSGTVSVLSAMAYALSTADNTANVYDIGIYGPNCRASATGVPLVFHTGPTAGTVLAASTGVKTIAITGAPVNVNMIPGWYCFANTSSAAAPAAVFAGDSVNTHVAMFTHGAAPAGGTGTTSGGTLNSTITAPATSVLVEPTVFVAGY